MTRFVYLHRKLLPTLAGLVLLLLGGLLAGEDKLASRVEEFLAQPHFKTAHWGYLFVDLTSGEVVLERNPEKLFVPASTTKLFSTAAALDASLRDASLILPLVAPNNPRDLCKIGDELVVIGRVVHKPKDNLAGYDGNEPRVLLVGFAVRVPKTD